MQNGTSPQELQQLGAWASHEMVLRYAHLSSNHLKQAAERVAISQNSAGTNLVHQGESEFGRILIRSATV